MVGAKLRERIKTKVSSLPELVLNLYVNMMSALLVRSLSKQYQCRRAFLYECLRCRQGIRNASNGIHSLLTDVQIPDVSLPEFVFQHSHCYPNKVAVECSVSGKKYTFEELRRKSNNLNKALRKNLKLKQGDVIAVLLPNIPEFPICLLGSLEAGLTVTTINPLYTADEIKRQLLDANAKAVFTLTTLYSLAAAAVKLGNSSIPIITIKTQNVDIIPQGSINFHELVNTKIDIDDAVPINANNIALLPYSSGTTGLPKGVQLTHKNIVANLCQIGHPFLRLARETTSDHQDVVPGILPWFHIYGMTAIMLNHLTVLSKIVSLPKFTPELYIQTLVQHKPQILFIVPPIVLFMTSHPSVKKEYLQSVRSIVSGAAPLGASDEKKFLAKVEKPINMLQGYGLSETSPCVFMTSPIRKKELGFFGSVGEIVSNTTVKIIPADNPQGDMLGPNIPGEIYIKGPQVMQGYHNKPQETKDSFVDGWFRTGDLAYYDKNQMFYIADRLKELIKVKGFQVAPAELEEVLRSHPDILDAAVIGVPHKNYGEAPRAYVVAKPNKQVSSDTIENYVAEKVAVYKKLNGGIAFVDAIPKNASGKIMRKQLKEEYQKSI